MMVNSRQKGKRGELEVVHLLKEYGFDARRGQQFKGTSDSPDIIHDIHGIYIEVKLRQNLNLHTTIEKADEEKEDYQKSVVFHRKNSKPWLVTLHAGDFLKLLVELLDETRSEP